MTCPELIQRVRDTGGPFCGDVVADAVAGWVRSKTTASMAGEEGQ